MSCPENGDLMRRQHSRIAHTPGLRLAIALSLTLSGCFGYARIERRSATALEARIERSDSEKLFVTSGEGKEETVNRGDVVDIDHPGKVRLTLGTMIAAAGAAMLIYGLAREPCRTSHPGSGEGCEEAFLNWILIMDGAAALLGGSALAITGGFAYHNSTTATEFSPAIPSTQAMRHSLPRLTCSFCSQ
jgi:hypothetical protein